LLQWLPDMNGNPAMIPELESGAIAPFIR